MFSLNNSSLKLLSVQNAQNNHEYAFSLKDKTCRCFLDVVIAVQCKLLKAKLKERAGGKEG